MLISRPFKLVVGLGNPGEEYRGTYHNAGEIALERLSAGLKFKEMPEKRFAYAKRGETVFVRPLAYMNESGGPVRAALDYFRVTPEDVLILHDDSDLPIGECKLDNGRGSAGHKGVDSVIAHLGTKEFTRLRIGIRSRPGKAGDFVLKRIPPPELEQIYGALDGIQVNVAGNQNPS